MKVDCRIASIAQSSLSIYRYELLADNIAGIPIQQQHGSDDHNVPAFHSRCFYQLTGESRLTSRYDELSGKSHWFDGVMVTEALSRLYKTISNAATSCKVLPETFRLIIPNSGGSISRGHYRGSANLI